MRNVYRLLVALAGLSIFAAALIIASQDWPLWFCVLMCSGLGVALGALLIVITDPESYGL